MAKKTDDTKPTQLTEHELGEYLLWRYNLGGYDDNIAAWRESLKPKSAGAGADTKQE